MAAANNEGSAVKRKKTPTKWQKQIKPSPILSGND